MNFEPKRLLGRNFSLLTKAKENLLGLFLIFSIE